MKVGSLFSGVGGMDIAAERAGMEVAWQSEVDRAASNVLNHYWPDLNLGDIHDICIRRDESGVESGSVSVAADREGLGGLHSDIRIRVESNVDADHEGTVRNGSGGRHTSSSNNGGTDGTRYAPAVDVLCGGFPCQDYSVAGNREGLAGDRGALWWEYHRLITEGRPTWVVAENVPGLLSSRDGEDFATIIDSLTELGYGVVWGVLDAQWFGVAQRRRRVFIVAHSGGRPRPEILALSEGMYGHPAPSRQTGQDVTGTLDARTRGGGFPGTDFALAGGVQAFSSSGKSITGSLTTKFGPKNYSNHQEVMSGSLVALAAESGMKQQTYVVHATQEPIVNGDRAHALGANSYQAVVGSTVRRLTPLECQRLQGFPDDWYHDIDMPDSQKYRQMGNAVAVPVVTWIMKRIADA